MTRDSTDATVFWAALKTKCDELGKGRGDDHWTQRAVRNLSDVHRSEPEQLSGIRRGVQRAAQTVVVYLQVPEDALVSRSAQEAQFPDQQTRTENISNVEHLFHRLNAGGVRLEGDELAYSMIKAYWPHVEEPIGNLAHRRMPEARLFTLAARVALAQTRHPTSGGADQRIPGPISVSDVRRLANDRSRAEQRHAVLNFLHSDQGANLASVIDKVEEWLGDEGKDEDDIGLPPVLKTSIARLSPEVYLLLMWLAKHAMQQPNYRDISDRVLRKRILGLATALHWFGDDKLRAAQAIAAELDSRCQGQLEPSAFEGVLTKGYDVGRRVSLYHPISPRELEELIALPDEGSLGGWRWYGLVEHGDEAMRTRVWPFLYHLKDGKELLLYAQRAYIKRRFGDYDPARTDMWEQHDRPWDFDHILPSAKTYYRNVPNKDALNEWIYSVANLRAWPMENNRSDQEISPEKKLEIPEHRRQSFISDNEIDGFARGYKGISSPSEVLAFMKAARVRLLRIYRAWYDPLDIAVLSGSNGDQ
jgi:hypothetical protein